MKLDMQMVYVICGLELCRVQAIFLYYPYYRCIRPPLPLGQWPHQPPRKLPC
jgi:hypothetical protein